MNEKEIKKIYKTKIDNLKQNNYLYFEKNDPKIDDSEYDKLKKEVLDLEKRYKFLKSKFSPSVRLGHKPL